MEYRTETVSRDLELPGGCVLCGGPLSVRVGPSGARSCCKRCRWVSRVQLSGEGGELHMVHPPGGVA